MEVKEHKVNRSKYGDITFAVDCQLCGKSNIITIDRTVKELTIVEVKCSFCKEDIFVVKSKELIEGE